MAPADRVIVVRNIDPVNKTGNEVQNGLNPPEASAAANVGLRVQSNSDLVWTRPNRPGLPVYKPQCPHWFIGCHYFGGISKWVNPRGTFPWRDESEAVAATQFTGLCSCSVTCFNNYSTGR